MCVKSFFEFEETTMKDSKNVKVPMKPLLKEPKRKHTNEQILTPFPVPVASIYVAGEDAEYKGYTGSLKGDSVVIECSKEAKSLYLRVNLQLLSIFRFTTAACCSHIVHNTIVFSV